MLFISTPLTTPRVIGRRSPLFYLPEKGLSMDLSSENLSQYKTKALLRNGRKAIFIGTSPTPQWPYVFNLFSEVGAFERHIAVRADGSVSLRSGAEDDYDVVRIIRKWLPRVGDEVKIIGAAYERDRSGNITNNGHYFHVYTSRSFIVDELRGDDAVYISSPTTTARIVVHKCQLQLVRRGNA